MNRTVHIAKNHKEAEEWDIQQQLNMTPHERQQAALQLKKKVYGDHIKDVRAAELSKNGK